MLASRSHRECIYNWITEDISKDFVHKTSLYQSKHKEHVKEFYKQAKSKVPKTMGHVPAIARNPKEYLKKYSGIKQEQKETKHSRCECKEQQKTKTKSQTTMDQEGIILRDTFKRNFIRENALNVIRRPASTPNPRLVDDRKGNSIDLEHSGLVPKYLQKEDYGEVPKYLRQIRESLEAHREEFLKFIYEEQLKQIPHKLKDETKKQIFEGLVRNWKALLRRYLSLPVQTDTLVQTEQKIDIERRMDSIEKDIELLSRNKDIYIRKSL